MWYSGIGAGAWSLDDLERMFIGFGPWFEEKSIDIQSRSLESWPILTKRFRVSGRKTSFSSMVFSWSHFNGGFSKMKRNVYAV